MKIQALFLLSVALVSAGPLEDSLATGRKALGNDGVATAWRIAQKALADAPDSAATHEFAGEVAFRRGDFARADAEFKNAIELNRHLAQAWWGLGRVAECAAMNRTAAEDYQRAYELDPKDPRILATWILHLQGRERDRALEAYVANVGATAEANELRQRIELVKALDGRQAMTLASPYRAYDLPLLGFENGATHVRTYGVEVLVNGNPVKLVLDTGAAGIVMSRAAAERAGLQRLAATTVRGIGDDAKVPAGYRALADHFRIGDVEYRNAVINVAEQNMAGVEDGLIGSNMFSAFLITIDFGHERLRLAPLPGFQAGNELQDRVEIAEMRDAAHVFRFGHILLVPARVNSHQGLFALDTGAASTMMSYDLAAEASKLDRDDRTAIRGLSGKVGDVYQTGTVLLEFAGFAQKNLAMTAIDTWQLSHRLGTEISGFLGLPVLDLFTLTIDYRDGLVKFERRP
jgi:predicted aspartyl protease/Tfp pilus assembly protein PilF